MAGTNYWPLSEACSHLRVVRLENHGRHGDHLPILILLFPTNSFPMQLVIIKKVDFDSIVT
jgi:hypothetical protein